jgi:hypothetical protein
LKKIAKELSGISSKHYSEREALIVNIPLRDQLLAEFDKLPPEQQQQMVALAKRLNRPPGKPARSLLKFAGRIPPDDIEKMEQALNMTSRW